MIRFHHAALVAFCSCLLASAVSGMEYYAGSSPSAILQPLNPQWRNNAYQGMVRQINPKHVQNVKFLFLGEPVPATVRGYGAKPDIQGYGGLVAVRKKSILWLVMDSIRFYLVDANGNLLTLTDIDTMEAGQVSPQFYDVQIDYVTTMQPNPRYRPPNHDRRGNRGFRRWRREPEYIPVTEERKRVVPLLDGQNYARMQVFLKTKVDQLPVCQ